MVAGCVKNCSNMLASSGKSLRPVSPPSLSYVAFTIINVNEYGHSQFLRNIISAST
jgi:hypothetical protein